MDVFTACRGYFLPPPRRDARTRMRQSADSNIESDDMDFTFTEDQLLFQESVADFLRSELTPEKTRALWETESGRSDELWQQLAELGLTGMTVPEEFGGLGMNEVDFVLLAVECGYVALSEPLLQTVLVAVPTLMKSGNDGLCREWLPKIAAGEARVAVGLEENRFVEDAHLADLLLLERDGALYAVTAENARITFNESVDPGRKLYSVDFGKGEAVALGGDELVSAAMNRGVLAAAAQSLGLAQRMVDMTVQYTSERKQFGVAIGTFQAVKHHMANIAYKLEYARAPLYRAANSLAHDVATQDRDVSHAKLAATEVAQLAAKNCIQAHGAMGYTWEVDLHIFMKRAWALNNTWGDVAFHKRRVADYVFADDATLGAAATFG